MSAYLEKLNRFENVTVEQFAIHSGDDGSIIGGFTMVSKGEWALMGGLHIDPEHSHRSLVWLFKRLRAYYPQATILEAYLQKLGRQVRWSWVGDRLLRNKLDRGEP